MKPSEKIAVNTPILAQKHRAAINKAVRIYLGF